LTTSKKELPEVVQSVTLQDVVDVAGMPVQSAA